MTTITKTKPRTMSKRQKIIDYFIQNPMAGGREAATKFLKVPEDKPVPNYIFGYKWEARQRMKKAAKTVSALKNQPGGAFSTENNAIHPAADSHQVGGNHYKALGLQPWDALEQWMSKAEFSAYLRGSAIEYLARYNGSSPNPKFRVETLLKARHVLDKLIETISA